MEAQKLIQELIFGKQQLVSQLAHTQAQIKDLKAHRKSLRIQVANSDGAIAAIKRLEADKVEEVEEADQDES